MDGEYSVYVIKCKEGRLYIGLSSDVNKRISAHNKKLSKWTSRFDDWKLIYVRKFDDYSSARKWETFLKKQKGGNNFKKIIAEHVAHNPA